MSIRQWKDSDPYRHFIPGDRLRDAFRRYKSRNFSGVTPERVKQSLLVQANAKVERRERGFYDGNKTEQAHCNGLYLDGLFSMHRLK